MSERGRPADVYVFCWHPVSDDTCDQRLAEQWEFFVVPSSELPDQKSISFGPLWKLARPVRAGELRDAVRAYCTG